MNNEYFKTGLTGWEAMHLLGQDDSLEVEYDGRGVWFGYYSWIDSLDEDGDGLSRMKNSFTTHKFKVRKKRSNLDKAVNDLWGRLPSKYEMRETLKQYIKD